MASLKFDVELEHSNWPDVEGSLCLIALTAETEAVQDEHADA